jgi:hypothetical protein
MRSFSSALNFYIKLCTYPKVPSIETLTLDPLNSQATYPGRKEGRTHHNHNSNHIDRRNKEIIQKGKKSDRIPDIITNIKQFKI